MFKPAELQRERTTESVADVREGGRAARMLPDNRLDKTFDDADGEGSERRVNPSFEKRAFITVEAELDLVGTHIVDELSYSVGLA
jgi:hypothetical protein